LHLIGPCEASIKIYFITLFVKRIAPINILVNTHTPSAQFGIVLYGLLIDYGISIIIMKHLKNA